MTVSDRIKARREELHMSQEDLAAKLGLSDKSSISRIENKGDDVTMKNITRIATALSTTPKYLLGWQDTPEENNKYTTLNHIYCVLKRDKNTDDRAIPLMFGYDSEDEMLSDIKKNGPFLIPYSRVKELCETYNYDADYLMGSSSLESEPIKITQLNAVELSEEMKEKYDLILARKDISDFIEIARVSNPDDVQRLTNLLIRLNNSVC